MTVSDAGTVRVPVADAQGRYAVAWVCRSPANPSMGLYNEEFDIRLLEATAAEQPSATLSCVNGPSETWQTFNFATTGVSGSERENHVFGFQGLEVNAGAPAGRGDLVSVATTSVGQVLRATIARDQDFTQSGTASIDLSPGVATAVSPPVTFTIGGVATGCTGTHVNLDIVERGFDLTLATSKLTRYRAGYGANSCTPQFVAPVFPVAMLDPADTYVLRGFLSSDVVAGVFNSERIAGVYRVFRTLPGGTTAVPIALGTADIPRTTGESVTEPSPGVCEFQLAATAGDRLYVAERRVYGGGSTAGARWIVQATPARVGASPRFSLPALASIAGYDAAWPTPACTAGWSVSAVRSDATVATAFAAWSWPTGQLGDVTLSFAIWQQP